MSDTASTMVSVHRNVETPRLLLTAREAAGALSISQRTLWTLTRRGEIPCVRIGRLVRYDPRDLEAYIDAARARACQ